MRHPDGRYRWVRARGLCVRDAGGEPLRMAGSVSDIDTRRRTEEALRVSESASRLPSPARTSGSGTGTCAPAWRSNRARARDSGLPPGPGICSGWTIWSRRCACIRTTRRCAPSASARTWRGRLPAYEVDYRVRHDDGQYRWVRVRALCIPRRAGRAVPHGRLGGRHRRAAPRARRRCGCRRSATRSR